MHKALIVVDYQFDFADPNGSLYIKGAEELKEYIEDVMHQTVVDGNVVIATRDFHPKDHISFETWPVHCVKNTKGCKYYLDEFYIDMIDFHVKKGIKKQYDSYSAFFDDNNNSNGLDEFLKAAKITHLTLVGVALDVCVKTTYEDAIKLGYQVEIDYNGVKGINE